MDLVEKQRVIDVTRLFFGVTFDALEQSDETYDLQVINLLARLKKGLIDAIETMPSAQPEPQWIPCNWHKDTENLPDECKSVLICIKDKIGTYVDVSYRTDYNRWERYGRNINVVAWMPLPEPWRGEEHG